MSKERNFEYIIIGSGPSGSATAIALAKAKKRVCVIEKYALGGSHLNSRDIPHSVALNAAHCFTDIVSLPEFRSQNLSFSLPSLHAHQSNTINSIKLDLKRAYKNNNITFLRGTAHLLDANTVSIDNKKLTTDCFILATGSTPKIENIIGTNSSIFHTPETAFSVRRLPKVVVVIGGGSAGCEIAEFYAELGSKVIILEMESRILPREDSDTSTYITNLFSDRFGITVLPNSKAIEIHQDSTSKCVIFHDGHNEKMIRTECIILATGSQPALDYGLENANIKFKKSGIVTNKYFQTSTKNIYAIGDCLGKESSTERATYEGNLLASNLLGRTKSLANYAGFTRITKTYPEIATIGTSEANLINRRQKHKKSIVNFSEFNANKIYGDGFVKLLADKTNHIVGATIVARNANNLSSEISLAIRHNLTALEIASTPHSIDNYNYAIKLAAKQITETKN